MAQDLNIVALTGRLTKDPELRTSTSGTSVTSLRIASNASRKVNGQWTEKPNFFDVTLFNGRAESAARYLAKGHPVAIEGRLEWSEWTTADDQRRQGVRIIADFCRFLSKPANSEEDSSSTTDPALASVQPDDDIPF
jgi:single-strand DNA-binding protein